MEAATAPPLTTQKQQQRLPAEIMGSADRTPIMRPPKIAGCVLSVVILTAEVRDELLSLQISQRVLQLHQLNEQIVLGIEAWRVNGALEIKGQPLLDAVHAGAAREIEE